MARRQVPVGPIRRVRRWHAAPPPGPAPKGALAMTASLGTADAAAHERRILAHQERVQAELSTLGLKQPPRSDLARLRRAALECLANGPQTTKAITRRAGMSRPTAALVLDHPWFVRLGRSLWDLSATGRQAAAAPEGGSHVEAGAVAQGG